MKNSWRKFLPNRFSSTFLVVALLFAVALIARIVFSYFFTNCTGTGDSGSRMLIGYNMAEAGKHINLFPSATWLPLHFWLMAIAFKCSSFSPVAVLSIHLIAGACCAVNFYFLCKKIFARYAVYAAFSIAVLPCLVYLSAQTMTEVWYIFFASLALLFRIKFHEKQSQVYLLVMSLSLAAATLLRYEAWVFTGGVLLSLYLFTKHEKFKAKEIRIALISLSGCILIMAIQLLSGLHPLYGVLKSDSFVAWKFGVQGIDYRVIFFDTYPAVIPFAIAGFLLLWFQYKNLSAVLKIYMVVVTLPFLAFCVKLITLTIDPDDRYMIIHSVFLIPFSFFFIDSCFKKIYRKKTPVFLFYVPVTFCIITYPLRHKMMTSGIKQPQSLFDAAYFTNQNIHGSFVVDEVNNYAESLFLVYTRTPNQPKTYNGRTCALQVCNVQQDLENTVKQKIQSGGVNYILLYANSRLSKVLCLRNSKEIRYGSVFNQVFSQGDISIYQILPTRIPKN